MSDDYTKSLEETIAKQERVIEDFVKDRDRIVKMLDTIRKSTYEIKGDIEKLADPLNPAGSAAALKIIQEVMKNKLIQTLQKYSDDISGIISYSNTDPSEYMKTGKHWAVPVIRSVKDPH
jgi:hypothetical protein